MVADFLIDRFDKKEQILQHVEEVREKHGVAAANAITRNRHYASSTKFEYLSSEISKEAHIPSGSLYTVLTPANGADLAEFGITMRPKGNKYLWYYDPALITQSRKYTPGARVVQPYAIPEYPGEKDRVSVPLSSSAPTHNGRGERIVGTYHLSEIEVGWLRVLHDKTIVAPDPKRPYEGPSNPRAAMLLVYGVAQGLFDIVNAEGKDEYIEALRAEVIAAIPDATHCEVDAMDMYPLPGDAK